MTATTPTATGTLSGFSVSPALPTGLSLSPTNGTISGTPSAVAAAATYTVTANVSSGGTTSATLSIAVNDIPPSNVAYPASSFTFSVGVASSTLTPHSAGGAVVAWTINPALPAGLNFNTTNGSISGTPTATSAATQYTVTAQNSGGPGTVAVTIAVDATSSIHLGHQTGITQMSQTATNVLSLDMNGYWILWDYAGASEIASGNVGCSSANGPCTPVPAVGMAGSTAVIATPTGLEVHSTSNGQTLASIATTANWWRLATDGTYLVAGSTTSLSAWSPSGQQLFSQPGDYSKALGFAAPGQVLVGAGPAGSNVVQTIAVPSGTATTGPQFNGTFGSWFLDGGHFTTIAGTTVLVYSSDTTQQGSIASVQGTATVVGQGNWVWTYPNPGAVLNIYPVTGTNTAPAATYTFTGLAQAYPSGTTIGVLTDGSTAVSVIDLSGATPARADFTAAVPLGYAQVETAPYVALSASQWLVSSNYGVVLDSGDRSFGYGQAWSIAGGTGHFAIATASGTILYFNSATLMQEGQIAFAGSKLALSSDGSVLVALGANSAYQYGNGAVEVYSLPAGSPLATPMEAGTVFDIALSGSGTVFGQVAYAASQYIQEASPTTGGAVIFSSAFSAPTTFNGTPPLRISPDGTLIAFSQQIAPSGGSTVQQLLPGTNLYQNGTFITAFSGLTVGWLDDSRLVVDNYVTGSSSGIPTTTYAGCTLYGATGSPTGGACALPAAAQLQPVTSDLVYLPTSNQIVSVSTGMVSWASADLATWLNGAVAGSNAIFVSGTDVLAQSF